MKADFFPQALWKTLYNEMQYENALAIRTALETGLRIGDVLALEKKSFDGDFIHFVAAKTHKSGKKRISADLRRRLLRVAGEKFIFPGRDSESKHRTRQAVYKDLVAVARRYGVTAKVTPHSARKTYAVDLYHDKGLQVCQKELQHDREFTTLLYALSDKISSQKIDFSLNNSDKIDEIAQKVAERLFALFEKKDGSQS